VICGAAAGPPKLSQSSRSMHDVLLRHSSVAVQQSSSALAWVVVPSHLQTRTLHMASTCRYWSTFCMDFATCILPYLNAYKSCCWHGHNNCSTVSTVLQQQRFFSLLQVAHPHLQVVSFELCCSRFHRLN
jgi:hypothetical protein